ncbi:MAG: peptidase S8 [Spirochaetales bacterium]|nr:peptidase S8 [Spirochaetales bacterium]
MKKVKGLWVLIGAVFFFGTLMSGSFIFRAQEKPYSEVMVSVKPGQDLEELENLAQKYGFSLEKQKYAFQESNWFSEQHQIYRFRKYDVNPEALNQLTAAFARLEKSGIIQEVEPNYQVKAYSSDPLFSRQWNLQALDIENVWKQATGKGVVVAVIDTGVGNNLGDLSPSRLVKGWNFILDNGEFNDDHGHGSHVAGTIGQDTDNNIGVAGIAFDSKIMPLKVLSKEGYGQISDIAEAIVYAAENGANIINMSLGGGGFSQVLKDACDYAAQKGVIVIAAAGNSAQNHADYPGAYESVIAVAAANAGYELSFYSNYGQGVDVIAPGGETRRIFPEGILQNAPEFLSQNYKGFEKQGNDYFYYFQGTSMASPHVAGVAALLYELGVRDSDKMRDLLSSSSDREIAALPFINPLAAINSIKNIPNLPDKAPVKAPEGISFNAGAVTASPFVIIMTLLIGSALFVLFEKTRKKVTTIDQMIKPMSFAGIFLGAGGLGLLGWLLQNQFPFTLLPERFNGLLFNSLLDYDRVVFFLNQPTPFWHNFLIPLAAAVLLNFKDPAKRRFTVGLLLGFSAKLFSEAFFLGQLAFLPAGPVSVIFLAISALLVLPLAYVVVKE